MKEVEKKEQVSDSHFGANVQRIKQQRGCQQRHPPQSEVAVKLEVEQIQPFQ